MNPELEATARAEKWLLEYPQAIAIRNDWGPDVCFYSHKQTIELLSAFAASQTLELTEQRDAARANLLERRKHDDANREERNQLAERAEAAEAQAQATREEDCKAVCYGCKHGVPLTGSGENHASDTGAIYECRAAAIRALGAAAPSVEPLRMTEVSQDIYTSKRCTCPNQADEDGAYCPICGKLKTPTPEPPPAKEPK